MSDKPSPSLDMRVGGEPDPATSGSPSGQTVPSVAVEKVADAVADVLAESPSQRKSIRKLVIVAAAILVPVGGWLATKSSGLLDNHRQELQTHIREGHPYEQATLQSIQTTQNEMKQDIRELRSDVKDLLKSSVRGVADCTGDPR